MSVAVSFVIPTHARRDVLRGVLERLASVADRHDGPVDVVVVDDASSDGTSAMLAETFPAVQVVRNEVSRGFDALPEAVERTRGELVFFLDDDAYPDEGTLDAVVAHFETRGPRLGLVALPFVEPESGRTVYSSYLPRLDRVQGHAPTPGFFAGAAVFRREVLLEVPASPPGYFLYMTEPATTLEVLASGWEADFLAGADVFHMFAGRRDGIRPMQAWLPLRNDLVTIRRYYRGLRRFEMLAGRYLTGAIHLAAAGALGRLRDAHRESLEMTRRLGVRDVPAHARDQVYRCFDGLTLTTLLSETSRRRVAYAIGRLPIDQVS